MTSDPTPSAFTGRRRDRKPKRSVLVADKAAGALITVGGLGSILAVSMVGVFLIWVAAPLFFPPSVGEAELLAPTAPPGAPPVIDEQHTLSWTWLGDGRVEVRSLLDGRVLKTLDAGLPQQPTAWSLGAGEGRLVLGYADGTVQTGRIDFRTEYPDADTVPAELHDLPPGGSAVLDDGVVQRTPEGQFRLLTVEMAMDEPVALAQAPIRLVDMNVRPSGPVFAALDSAGTLALRSVRERKNLLSGEITRTLRGGDLTVPQAHDARWLLINGRGDNIFLARPDGLTLRVDASDIRQPVVAETVDLTGPAGAELTSLAFQIGKSSLVAGDAEGGLNVWYRTRPEDAATTDGQAMVKAVTLEPGPAAVTALAASARSRLMAAGYADGSTRLYYVTNHRLLAALTPEHSGAAIRHVALAPRDDALLTESDAGLILHPVDAPHPEAGVAALLTPVWYEGYDTPAHVWQSTGGTDEFEPKYGLVPLIVGTLKATFYTMIFGLPLALLAAVYTSEFLEPRSKARVKPVIEMMASLPSVVLGFLAALVFAPFLESRVPMALAAVLTVPFSLLLGAHLWQLLPGETAVRHDRWKLPLMILLVPVGVGLAAVLGGPVEHALFAGDIMAWLDGQIGGGTGGWVVLLLPLASLATAALADRVANPWLRARSEGWSRTRFAVADLGKLLAATAFALTAAVIVGWMLSTLGWDPRGAMVGTYVQRNALVVGFVMGFAVIPIIYTIAEDALSAVPDHLRAASLGAGATPWQTAVRVVIPPATSGLFSAAMIGLGRAVGETMIVLMAAGNTPIMDWNIFNGFRTLSANIAVELPEAVQNSTHFRTLFLAALTLFAMTFVLNTAAEIVRLRFRKKAYQL